MAVKRIQPAPRITETDIVLPTSFEPVAVAFSELEVLDDVDEDVGGGDADGEVADADVETPEDELLVTDADTLCDVLKLDAEAVWDTVVTVMLTPTDPVPLGSAGLLIVKNALQLSLCPITIAHSSAWRGTTASGVSRTNDEVVLRCRNRRYNDVRLRLQVRKIARKRLMNYGKMLSVPSGWR